MKNQRVLALLRTMANPSPFPPCTPVWYHLHQTSEFNHQTVLRIYEGIVRSSSILLGSGKREFKVLQHAENTNANGVLVDTVDENCLAFAPQCPVKVSLKGDSTTPHKINGEIVNILFSPCTNSKEILIRYTVKLYTDDGNILVENGIPVERLQYRFGLDELRANLKEDYRTKKMIGIRTNSLGIPLQKGKVTKKLKTSKHHIRKQSMFVQLQSYQNHRAESEDNSVGGTVSTMTSKICKNYSCSHHAQENFDGYCFKHYFLFLRSDNNGSSNLAAPRKTKSKLDLNSENAITLHKGNTFNMSTANCVVATNTSSESQLDSGKKAPKALKTEEHVVFERHSAMHEMSVSDTGRENQNSDVIDLTEDD